MSLLSNTHYVFLYEKLMMQLMLLEAIKSYQEILLSKMQKPSLPDNTLFSNILASIGPAAMQYSKHTSILGPAGCLFSINDIPIIKEMLINLELPYFIITNSTREKLQERILATPDFSNLLQKLNTAI